MTDLERAMEQIGLCKSDIEKHVKNGATLFDLESYIDSIDGIGLDWEDMFNMSKAEFVNKWNNTTKDTKNYVHDCDFVILDGEKYMIAYCL